MAKHAKNTLPKKVLVSSLSAGMALGVGVAVQANGDPADVCTGDWVKLDAQTCELDDHQSLNSALNFVGGSQVLTIPEGATKLAAILIAQGGRGVGYNSTYYPGSPGEVKYIEIDSPEDQFTVSSLGDDSAGVGYGIRFESGGSVLTASGSARRINTDPDTEPEPIAEVQPATIASLAPAFAPASSVWQSPSTVMGTEINWTTVTVGGNILSNSPAADFGRGSVDYNFSLKPAIAAIRVSFAPLQQQAAAPRPYTGPINLLTQRTPAQLGGVVTATGDRLDTVTKVLVNGIEAQLESISVDKLTFKLPAGLEAGTYKISYEVSSNNVTLTDSITVVAPVRSSAVGSYVANRVFANYRGDSGSVAARDANALRSYVGRFDNVTKVTCIGSTSGIPSTAADRTLALARAKSACDVIQREIPGVEVTLKTSTGKGIGQRFRNVQIFIQGLR